MGCFESLPDPNAFKRVHHCDPKIPYLGSSVPGVGPSSKDSIQLVVREKLFSWSGDTFKIKTKDGVPFHGLQIKGKFFSARDRMTLLDENKQPVAVCLRKFQFSGQTFKIYRTKPLFPEQKPSTRMYDNNTHLFTYCKVERKPFSIIQDVTFANEKTPSFTIHRAGSVLGRMQRVVKHHGIPAALMEGGRWAGNWNTYLLTINPGIDPCLIICLTAICDEMDETDSGASGNAG